MKKLTDEEIDSLFKEAAANYEPAYHPSEWEVMNKKLEGKPFRIPTWIFIMGIGSLVFLSGIGVGIWMNNQPTVNTQPPNEENALLTVKSDTVSSNHKNNQVQSNLPIAAQPLNPKIVSSRNEQPPQNESKETIISSSTALPQVSNYKSGKARLNIQNEKELITQPSQSQLNSNELESQLLINPVAANSSISDETKISHQEQQPSETIKLLTSHDSTLVQPNENTKTDSSIVNDLKEESKKENVSGKWFIKVMASPDNSSINFSSGTFAGTNFTALIEYQLTNRWSVSTGIILSNKKYQTDAETLYKGKKATGLDGSCRVLDIPITVYYRISTSKKLSFYSGIGFSSYLMLSENYKYSLVYNSISYPYDTKVEGKNNEWFKMLNLSFGLNYQLTNRWSIQAEPFAKLPMAGVGEGKVMLSTTGMFIGIKYKIH